MAYFAELSDDGTVIRVIVIPDEQQDRGQEYISKDLNLGGTWIETFFNGGDKKNYAGVGYTFSKELDAFIPPIPNEKDGYYLDEKTCQWKTDKIIEGKKII